ncbi:MAG: glycosyltransferase [Bacteroidia bacterium]|nr:glycosyltransferase [Bacteroidia bacterium]
MKTQHNILVFTYWSFNDALIQTYTLPYLRLIKSLGPENISITLVTLEQNHKEIESVKKVTDSDFSVFPLPYFPFGAKAVLKWLKNISVLKKLAKEKKINTIHTWCTPAGMIGYILHKRTGIKLIADSFEPHAGSMVENGTWKKNSPAFKILFRYEKLIAKHAEKIIAIAPGMEKYISETYNVETKDLPVKPACVDLNKFSEKNKKDANLLKELGLTGKTVALYAGKFGGIYLDKEVFAFFKTAYDFWGDNLRILLLTNEEKDKLKKRISEAGIPETIFVIKFVPHKEIPVYMGLADFAICPVKSVYTKRFCSPIKTGEYWALGLPVIITQNISNDSEIIEKNKAGYVWKELNEKEFKNSVVAINKMLTENSSEQLYQMIRPLAEKYRNYKLAARIYKTIYD